MHPSQAKPAILIVDDAPANLSLLADHLGEHGFAVSVAEDGEEGLARARFAAPDLILLDVMMSGWGGFETCRRLKAEAATRDIPIIFMTALSDIGDKVEAYQAGAVDYVTKPFHTDEVLARVKTHLALQHTRRELAARNRELQQEVAERLRAEAVLARRQLELARSNAELEQMAYIASHDLQEPLRMVASYVQLLAQRCGALLDAEALEYIDFAAQGAQRMQALIDDLLRYSRVDTGAHPLRPTDCGAAVAAARRALQLAIDDSAARISCAALPVLPGDPAQLAQLFQNLIGNAIKFRRDQGPRIDIRAKREGRFWCCSVEDDGIGVAPEYRLRIFDMFQRLHGCHAYPGTGIGLAICKKIVERHGGRIWVEAAPERGSIFRFTLPCAPPEAAP